MVPEVNSGRFWIAGVFVTVNFVRVLDLPINRTLDLEGVARPCVDQTAKSGRLNCSQIRAGRAAVAAVRMGVSSMNIFLLIIFLSNLNLPVCHTHTGKIFDRAGKKKAKLNLDTVLP